MALSWSFTLVYLCRHMKRMERGDSSFSLSRLRSQLRVTIMGIVQTVLSLLFFCFSFLNWYYVGQYDKDGYLYQGIILFFSFGTTLNLGLSQSLLRKRAADLSMSSCMWLSVFYYTKIVPVQQDFLIWIKRNSKTIIYCGLLWDSSIIVTIIALNSSFTCSEVSTNFTGNLLNFSALVNVEANTLLSIESLEHIHMLIFIILMGVSWSFTLVYLCRHMKRMERGDSSFSLSRLRSQLRVTIMGIVQTVLSLLFFCFSFLNWYYFSQYDQNDYIYQTMILFFSFGTTLNLGLSQSLLRKRAADLFNQVFQIVRKLRPFPL
uniref:Taste receptor type 2 n=1 Tax=Scleropages formosus TaxID=113540 RepID=A0A8C9WID0_SCLFO